MPEILYSEKLVKELMRRAFVSGAKWWEYESTKFTMWPSDQRLGWQASESKIERLLIEYSKEEH